MTQRLEREARRRPRHRRAGHRDQSLAGRLHPAPNIRARQGRWAGLCTVPGKTGRWGDADGAHGSTVPPRGPLDRHGPQANPPAGAVTSRETMRSMEMAGALEVRPTALAVRRGGSRAQAGRRYFARAPSAEPPLFNTRGRCSSAFCRNQARVAWQRLRLC